MLVDLLHLVRTLRRSPASAAAAVLTLSLTLGAGASIFAVIDAVLLTPPPFTNPDALVTVGETPIDDVAAAPRAVGFRTFEDYRERAGSVAAIEAFDGTNLTLTGLGPAERLSATDVTTGFLSLLGVTPGLGRLFDFEDAGRPVVIVSNRFWRGKLAGDPGAIGRQISLGGQAHTIVGVLPERFFVALDGSDVWRPLPGSLLSRRSGVRVRVVARLAPSRSAGDLGDALDDVSRRASPPARVVVTPMATAIAGGARGVLRMLALAAALALLIAFTNLAALLMVRSIDRGRELAIRSALGARRIEIARQLMLEAAALVAVGIAGGVLLASWMTPAVGRLALQQFGGGLASTEVAVSWRVIGAVSIVAAACAAICGFIPALVAARRSVLEILHRKTTPAPRERTLRRVLVCGEVALAFVLIVSVTLLGRSLSNVLSVNPGFDPRDVLLLQVSVPAATYGDTGRIVAFYSALHSALAERLGPRTIAIVDEVPLTGDRGRRVVKARPTDDGLEAVAREATNDYFDVLRIPLVAGRQFGSGDDISAPPRAIVSASLAERLFPSRQATGRQIWLAGISQPAEIIGVVGDIKHRALDEMLSPTVYLSAWQTSSRSRIVVVRSASAAEVVAAVREEVARLDPQLPVYGIRWMRDTVAASPGVPARRVLTAAFSGFAALAIVLGALGLFGVAAHDVASRRVELALRIALGADPRRLLRKTFAQGGLMVGSGLAVGSVLSIWAARALSSMIGSGGLDIASLAVAAAVLTVAGGVAVLPAALRAARTDPLIALRSE